MASERERTRCRLRLERLGDSSLDRESVQREAILDLQRVIGFDRWCWPLADPETLVPVSAGIAEHDYGPGLPRVLELEYSGDDYAAMDVLAGRATPAASLMQDTGGDLARSRRWDEVFRPVGIGDEAVVACRDSLGCWGWIKAYRDGRDRGFDDGDLELLADVAPSLGRLLRRRFVQESGNGSVEQAPPGVIVLDRELRPLSWTSGARSWIDALPLARLFAAWGTLPAVVYPVASRSRSPAPVSRAHALERTADGRWLVIEAEPLEGEGDGKLAVTLRGAGRAEMFELLYRVYALTRREKQIVEAIVEGLDTRAITERLFISRYTVQDHLKSIFLKVGVHSRRQLLATFGASTNGG